MKSIKCKECIKYIKDSNHFINDLIMHLSKRFRIVGVVNKGMLDQLELRDAEEDVIPQKNWFPHDRDYIMLHPNSSSDEIEMITTDMVAKWCLYNISAEDNGAMVLAEPPKVKVRIWPEGKDTCPLMAIEFKHIRLEPGVKVSLSNNHVFAYKFFNTEVEDYWYEMQFIYGSY